MDIGKASWIIVVVACGFGAVICAFAGYEGYAAVVAAVGLAASVNLLPRKTGPRKRTDQA